jgi:hypothetical protein
MGEGRSVESMGLLGVSAGGLRSLGYERTRFNSERKGFFFTSANPFSFGSSVQFV